MKTLYMIGGTMGVGKTTVCQQLKQDLPNSVFLDGDWCWDASPFQVTDETKAMVTNNICYLLNNFLKCSAYFGFLIALLPSIWKYVLGIIPLGFSVVMVKVCIERINEIKKGEEDDISKY